jgi:hypothetical protein
MASTAGHSTGSRLPAGTRVRVHTTSGAALTGEVASDYRHHTGVDFMPDVGDAIYLPPSRVRAVEVLADELSALWM